jgi:hypothetical protein
MLKGMTMTSDDPATVARNTLLQIVTAARGGNPRDMQLASQITNDYSAEHKTILPLFISSVAFIQTIILTVAEAMEIDPDKLFHGICLGLSVKRLAEENQQTKDDQ